MYSTYIAFYEEILEGMNLFVKSNHFLNERYLDPKQLFKEPIKAPKNQAILQLSINRLRNTITNDISIPPRKQTKQNKEKDFAKGRLEILLKTHNFAKIKETSIPMQ